MTDIQEQPAVQVEQDVNLNQNEQSVPKYQQNKAVIAYLAEKFPKCFFIEGEIKPLKIGLFQDLAEALADDETVSKTQLRHVLRQYTANWRYLHSCVLGAERVDLEGNVAGIVEQEHVDNALARLNESKAKVAEKRKAQRAALAEANKEKKRPAKKFNKNKAKPQQVTKKTAQPTEKLQAVNLETLKVGDQVKVKVAEKANKATVVELTKEGAKVELANGLVIGVNLDRLFA